MRILLTTDTVGGVWTFTRELTQGLLAAGHEVALVSLGRAPSAEQLAWAGSISSAFIDRFHYQASPAPLEWMQSNAEAFTAAGPAILQLVADFQPHILHSSQFCFGSLPLSIPKLITAHSDVLSWASACRPAGLPSSPWLEQYTSLVQQGLDQADAIVAPTQHMLDELARRFSLRSKIDVIPNGRSLPPASMSQGRLQQAVSVGRLWDEAKGLSTLLEIQSPVPIFIAGEEHFEAATADNSAPHLKPLGILTEAELLHLFRRSSVYLAPSLYEPFGLAPLEAALSGCAILARDIPSLREVWQDAALYFNTSTEFEHQLHTLFASTNHLREAQSAANHRAQRFTRHRMTSAYLALYEELIQPAETGPAPDQELASHAA